MPAPSRPSRTGRWRRGPDDPGELQQWLTATSGGIDPFAHYAAHVTSHRNYRIDWILLRGLLVCTAATIGCRHRSGLMPSDHYPVVAAIEWR